MLVAGSNRLRVRRRRSAFVTWEKIAHQKNKSHCWRFVVLEPRLKKAIALLPNLAKASN
jgi:hypothetical protein